MARRRTTSDDQVATDRQIADRSRPTTPEGWAGLARMAAARRHAGQPLTDLDSEALARSEARR